MQHELLEMIKFAGNSTGQKLYLLVVILFVLLIHLRRLLQLLYIPARGAGVVSTAAQQGGSSRVTQGFRRMAHP